MIQIGRLTCKIVSMRSRCGSASHCETLSIAVASLSHQIILSQPPIAFTCSISLSAVFPLRTSPTPTLMVRLSRSKNELDSPVFHNSYNEVFACREDNRLLEQGMMASPSRDHRR